MRDEHAFTYQTTQGFSLSRAGSRPAPLVGAAAALVTAHRRPRLTFRRLWPSRFLPRLPARLSGASVFDCDTFGPSYEWLVASAARQTRECKYIDSSSSRVSGLTGLTRCPSNPAAVDLRRSSSCPQPVTAISVVCAPHAWSRIRRHASYPFILGMPRSRSTICGRKSSASCRALSPSWATRTWCPFSSQEQGEACRCVTVVVHDQDLQSLRSYHRAYWSR